MRSEKEIYDLILDIARNDERILAVYMNGSRTNINVPKDIFQDYDIVYVVKETKSFIEDKKWIHRFGDILYMQYPDEFPGEKNNKENRYAWLMQFTDGVRIDLSIQTISFTLNHIHDNKLCRILLDKANVLPNIEESSDITHYVQKPSEIEFLACANEFWWCSNNIAKGLWRNEIPYVQDMTNFIVRKQLEYMLSWKAGIMHDFKVSVGKSGKYLYRYLDSQEYQEYLNTYFNKNVEDAWKSVFIMCDLFDKTAKYVGEQLGYTYNEKEARGARSFLERVYQLPKDATDI